MQSQTPTPNRQAFVREVAETMEGYQKHKDYLDGLLEKSLDDSVTVLVDGKTIRFESIDQLAEWLA